MTKCIPIVNDEKETYRSREESKLDIFYYLTKSYNYTYHYHWIEHNYNIFLKYHTLEYYKM